MKILYVKLPSSYSDSWTYQENILSTKFVQLGHETHLVVSTRCLVERGEKPVKQPLEYVNDFGVHVHILPYSAIFSHFSRKFDYYDTLYGLVNEIHPDFIFAQCVQFAGILTLAKYKRNNPKVKLVADNHADYIIMPIDNIQRWIVHKIIYRTFVRLSDRYINLYFGVSPSRGDYLSEVYGIDRKKINIIPQMGDDTMANTFEYQEERNKLCEEFCIDKGHLIIAFGAGNIDNKKNLLPLLQAVKNKLNVDLIVFGSFAEEVKVSLESYMELSNIHNMGRLSGKDIYKVLVAADIAIYPGQHSVLWDNTVACGTPLCVRRWKGMDYFDIDGNCLYITKGTKEELSSIIDKISDETVLLSMRAAAQGEAKKRFSATEVAKFILEVE